MTRRELGSLVLTGLLVLVLTCSAVVLMTLLGSAFLVGLAYVVLALVTVLKS